MKLYDLWETMSGIQGREILVRVFDDNSGDCYGSAVWEGELTYGRPEEWTESLDDIFCVDDEEHLDRFFDLEVTYIYAVPYMDGMRNSARLVIEVTE